MMIVFRAVLFAAGFLLLSSCGKEPLYQEQGFVFGTLVEVSIYGETEDNAKQAVSKVMQEFQRLHNFLHAWKPSKLSEINAAFAKGTAIDIPPEMQTIIRNSAEISLQSDGIFNPAIGGLIKLWGFQADDFKPSKPEEKKITALTALHPQMNDIVINLVAEKKVAHLEARSHNRAVQLDLGGYAKGYALDRAAVLLKQMKVNNALINIGGNIMAMGGHGARPWRVGIQHPRKPGPLATLDLQDGEAIGTSGDYQRYFEIDGKRYCHLIDPRSGQPAQGVQAVTVLTHNAQAGTLSDAISKPLFIAGPRGWLLAAKKMHVEEALLIDDSGTVHLTDAMQKRLEFTDQTLVRVVDK